MSLEPAIPPSLRTRLPAWRRSFSHLFPLEPVPVQGPPTKKGPDMLDWMKKDKGAAGSPTELPEDLRGEGRLFATFQTSMGAIVLELFDKQVPNTVANFVSLATGSRPWTDPATRQQVQRPLYDGTVFHRVIPDFMIQGGDPLGQGVGGPGYQFADEFHASLRHNRPGILSMANSGPNTNGSQFFITEAPTPHLDNRHSVFGAVVSGMDVVHKIAHTPRDARDKPKEPVVIQTTAISRSADAPQA